MVDESVVNTVRAYLRKLQALGLTVRFGVVFGSQASGEAGPWSDIDLLVVSPRFDAMRDRQDVNTLWHTAARTDSRIEPLPCGERQWQEDDSSAIVEIARREGQRISP
ncbi:MAG: nucleotidyltransferase domain-containing protein [Anaerolineae bacterium]|nr:nucleotidyltransferase domain-containing protein [Anaerolineae bacterium]